MEGSCLISSLCWPRNESNIPCDIWIEWTMNTNSYMKSGRLFIIQNEKKLLMHIGDVITWPLFLPPSVTYWANWKSVERHHGKCSPSKTREDKQCVQDSVKCMQDAYPFVPTTLILPTPRPGSDEVSKRYPNLYTHQSLRGWDADYTHPLNANTRLYLSMHGTVDHCDWDDDNCEVKKEHGTIPSSLFGDTEIG